MQRQGFGEPLRPEAKERTSQSDVNGGQREMAGRRKAGSEGHGEIEGQRFAHQFDQPEPCAELNRRSQRYRSLKPVPLLGEAHRVDSNGLGGQHDQVEEQCQPPVAEICAEDVRVDDQEILDEVRHGPDDDSHYRKPGSPHPLKVFTRKNSVQRVSSGGALKCW